MKGVIGSVVELRELCFGDIELEGSWLDCEIEDEEYEDNKDYDCEEKLPADAEEAATTFSSTVVVRVVGWRNGGAIVCTVQLGLLIISHV